MSRNGCHAVRKVMGSCPETDANRHASEGIHPGFETRRRYHQGHGLKLYSGFLLPPKNGEMREVFPVREKSGDFKFLPESRGILGQSGIVVSAHIFRHN